MLSKVLPQHSLNKCIDALAALIGRQGSCSRHKFDSYVSVYIEPDVLQRVGAIQLVSIRKNRPVRTKTVDDAEAFIAGERVSEDCLRSYYEYGIRYVARRLRWNNKFKKTADGEYVLRLPIGTINSKLCTKCHEVKRAEEFYKAKSHADGLQNWCMDCQRSFSSRKTKSQAPVEATPSKACTICKEVKPYEDFSKQARHTTGRRSACKDCTSKRNRELMQQRQQLQATVMIDVKAAPLLCLTSEPP